MKILYSWLKEFIELDLSIKQLEDVLLRLGFEVSNISEKKNEVIFDIDVPINRPDCLGHLGIARELAAKLKLRLKIPPLSNSKTQQKFPVDIQSKKICQRYIAKKFVCCSNKATPDLMKKRIEMCDINPINLLVDITNYTLLEIGHPLHVFDLKKLTKKKIVVKMSNFEEIVAINNNTYKLDNKTIIISDGEKPIAIAGIIGTKDSSVEDATTELLLESAVFNPQMIRIFSKKFNVVTDSSLRFERGSNFYMCEMASRRASKLIEELCDGRLIEENDIIAEPQEVPSIEFNHTKSKKMLGVEYNETDVEEALSRLEMKLERKKQKIFIIPPNFRRDIKQEADIIEEIAKIIGYDSVPISTSFYVENSIKEDHDFYVEKRIKDFLRGCGFQEVVNYTMVSKNLLDKLGIMKPPIKIVNPISSEFNVLRPSLLPSLYKNYLLTKGNNIVDVKVFEIGKIYSPQENERQAIGILCCGYERVSEWQRKSYKIDIYYLTGLIDGIFSEFGIKNYKFIDSQSSIFVPQASGKIVIDGDTVGEFGKCKFGDVYFAEMEIEKILKYSHSEKRYIPFSKFPIVKRDLSIVVNKKVKFSEINEIINLYSKFIQKVILFDIYYSDKIGKDKKSMTLTLHLLHPEKTLTDEEANEIVNNILNALKKKVGANLRKG